MLDINGIQLEVGDDVIYTNRNLNELYKGKIFKITKSKCVVKYKEDYHYDIPTTNGSPISGVIKHHHNIMSSDQVMKL